MRKALQRWSARHARLSGAPCAQVSRRGADDQLQGEQLARDHALRRRQPDPEADVDAVLHPVANPVIQFHVRLHLADSDGRTRAASGHSTGVKTERGPTMRKRPAISSLARRVISRARCKSGQCRQCGLQELPALVGERHAARGAMEQPHAQMLFQLRQRLAGRLRRHALRLGRLAQAAELGRLGEGGDGAHFIDGHAGHYQFAVANPSRRERLVPARPTPP